MNDRHRRLLGIAVTALVIALGVSLRILVVTAQGHFVWLDELHTVWVISGELSDVMPRAMIGNQSPLFFWFYYWATGAESINGISLRLPVVVTSLLTLLVLPWIVYQMTRSWYAILMALVIACLDATWVFYSTEARPFAAVQLFALLQFFCFWKVYVAPQRAGIVWQIGLIFYSTCLFYLHYTTLLFLACQGIFVFGLAAYLKLRRVKTIGDDSVESSSPDAGRSTTSILRLFLMHTLLILPMLAPGLKHLFSIAEVGNQWASFATGDALIPTLKPFWISYLLLPGIVLSACWFWQRKTEAKESLLELNNLNWPLALTSFAGPILVALILSSIPKGNGNGPLLALGHLRYVIASVAIAPVFVAILVASMKPVAARFASVCLIGIAVICFNPSMHDLMFRDHLSALRTERWGMVTSHINLRSRDTQTRRPVFLCSNLVEDDRLAEKQSLGEPTGEFIEYCRFPLSNHLYRLRTDGQAIVPIATFAERRFGAEDAELVKREGGGFLVVRGDPDLLDEIAIDLTRELSSKGVRIVAIGRIEMPQSNVFLLEFVTEPNEAP